MQHRAYSSRMLLNRPVLWENTCLRLESFYWNLFLAEKLLILGKKQTMENSHWHGWAKQNSFIIKLFVCCFALTNCIHWVRLQMLATKINQEICFVNTRTWKPINSIELAEILQVSISCTQQVPQDVRSGSNAWRTVDCR